MFNPVSQAIAWVFDGPRRRNPIYYGQTDDRNDPLAWLYRLETKLKYERAGTATLYSDGHYEWRMGLGMLDAYYDGHHPLPEVVDDETRARYLEFMRRSRSNYMKVVVDAERERIHLNGFRTGKGEDAKPDLELWEILQENGIGQSMPLAVKTALTKRRAYWSVFYGPGNRPMIRVEDPAQVIVEHDPTDRRKRVAAAKFWADDWTGTKFANIYLPNIVYKFYWHDGDRARPAGWYEREPLVRHGLGVPIIPMVNRPTMHLPVDGVSEIDGLTPIQDRINQTDLNRQIAEHFSAFRQKWATGIDIPTDENGEPIQAFSSAIDSFWVNTNKDGRWGEFNPTDLQNYDHPKQGDIQDIAILSATPRHYFTVNGQAPSGDSMKSAEAGLIAKVSTFIDETANPALIEVAQLCDQITGRRTAQAVTPIWADPEYRTFAQLVDGTAKLVETKIISRRYGREQIGMDPSTAARMEREIAEEAALYPDAIPATATDASDDPSDSDNDNE